MAKNRTPDAEQEIKLLCKRIRETRKQWEWINGEGGNDPFWPDGCNMNLLRNHMISYKMEIAELCGKHGIKLPEEYFLKIPPEVDNEYMANMEQKERIIGLRECGIKLSRKNTKFRDDGQMEFC